MKNGIGCSLPDEQFDEFEARGPKHPGGKSGLIKDALREYFIAHPMKKEESK